MNLIVAADLSWGIGLDQNLLVRIPEDMKFFKATTLGKVVVMGRTTFQSLPGSKPLSDRINIVLTGDPEILVAGAITCHSRRELFQVLALCQDSDIFVIGGESVYRQLLSYCKEAYVTRIMADLQADVHFPDLDGLAEWKLCEKSEVKSHGELQYYFCRYENTAVAVPEELPVI